MTFPFSNFYRLCSKSCFWSTFRRRAAPQPAPTTKKHERLNTVTFSVRQTRCRWPREHKYNKAVQTQAGTGLGPCEDRDESLVAMTHYTQCTGSLITVTVIVVIFCSGGQRSGNEAGHMGEKPLCQHIFLHKHTLVL